MPIILTAEQNPVIKVIQKLLKSASGVEILATVVMANNHTVFECKGLVPSSLPAFLRDAGYSLQRKQTRKGNIVDVIKRRKFQNLDRAEFDVIGENYINDKVAKFATSAWSEIKIRAIVNEPNDLQLFSVDVDKK